MEAGDPYVEARAVETADELDHLPLGSARMKTREEDDCRNWETVCHLFLTVPKLSKAGATRVASGVSRYCRCHSSKTRSCHSRNVWSRSPARCSRSSRPTNAGSK